MRLIGHYLILATLLSLHSVVPSQMGQTFLAQLGAAPLPQSDAVQQAHQAFRAGDLKRAASLARQVLAHDPESEYAHMILGLIAAREGEWKAAIKNLEAVVRLNPSSPHGNFFLGQAYHQQAHWEKAIPYLAKALESGHPERERLVLQLAVAQNEAGRPSQALESLSKFPAPAGGPPAAQYHAVSAFAHAALDRPGPAVDAVRRALKLDDSNPEYWQLLISTLISTDQKNRALVEAIQAQKKFPDNPEIQFQFGLSSYYVSHQNPFAKLALRNLEEVEPDSARVKCLEGLLHRRQGRTEEANRAFALAAERGLEDAHLLLGILLKEAGDYDGAEKEYREAEKVNPHNGQVHLELGKILLANGSVQEALPRLAKAADYIPKNPGVHYQLGRAYARLGQAEKAEYHFSLFRELDKDLRELSASAPAAPMSPTKQRPEEKP